MKTKTQLLKITGGPTEEEALGVIKIQIDVGEYSKKMSKNIDKLNQKCFYSKVV